MSTRTALPPTSLRPELRPAIDGVLARALAKDPARRYSSADELVSAARSALGLVETAPARPTRRRLALAAAGVAVLVVAALLGFLLTRDSGGGLSAVSPDAVGVIDPKTNELVADVSVGFAPEAIAAGEGGVWVANNERRVGLPPRSGLTHSHRHHPRRRGLPERHRCRERVGLGRVGRAHPPAPHRPGAGRGRAADCE